MKALCRTPAGCPWSLGARDATDLAREIARSGLHEPASGCVYGIDPGIRYEEDDSSDPWWQWYKFEIE